MDEKDYCFGYTQETGGCRILNEQSEYCNTPKCPFYKTKARMAEEKRRVEARFDEKGKTYYKNYYRY